MASTAKIDARISSNMKRYQNIIQKSVTEDINESDTVTIITDILCDLLGFDKYENITSEYAIRKTYCDLAIKVGTKVPLLIECKAIGIELKEDHVRQATNYAADSGIEWVVLTNARTWKVYKILFSQPVDKKLVYEFNFLELSARRPNTFDVLYPLCMESFPKGNADGLNNLFEQKQIFNRYVLGQILVSEEVTTAVRRKFKRIFPDMKLDSESIRAMLETEIIRREVFDEDESKDAIKLLKKAEKKAEKAKAEKVSVG